MLSVLVQKAVVPCLVSGALLLGVTVDWKTFHADVGGSAQYHERVKSAAEALPFRTDTWISEDIPAQASAVAILHPNVIMERRYRDISTGLEGNLLLVQCLDARDILGHYPPVCYVANGYTLESAQRDSRTVGSLKIDGMSYEFSSARLATRGSIKVYDFMILPDGETAPDMAAVNAIARNRHERHFGAAQIQVITDDAMPDQDRDRVIQSLLTCALPVINSIRSGTNR